jgi:hypothetical protein
MTTTRLEEGVSCYDCINWRVMRRGSLGWPEDRHAFCARQNEMTIETGCCGYGKARSVLRRPVALRKKGVSSCV